MLLRLELLFIANDAASNQKAFGYWLDAFCCRCSLVIDFSTTSSLLVYINSFLNIHVAGGSAASGDRCW